MQNDFNFCPNCGGKNIQNLNMRKWKCDDCGYTLYNNVAAAVGLVIQNAQGKILFEKRAKPKILCADPLRECREEIGVEPLSVKYIASFPNTYDYKNLRYKTCDIFFEAILPPNAELHAQEGEVLGFEEVSIKSEEDLKDVPLAFESARKTLTLWLNQK